MKKAKPINYQKYFDLLKEWSKSENFKIATNALVFNSISDMTVNPKERNLQPFSFSFDIKSSAMPVSNQNMSGRCWLFAALNMLRPVVAKKLNIDNIEFSESFLAFWDKFERVNIFLEKIIETSNEPLTSRELDTLLTNGIGDGGFFEMAVAVIKKYGIVPLEIMPDSFTAKNTDLLNTLINKRLKIAASDIRKANKDTAEQQEIKKECLKSVLEILRRCYGPIPQEFEYTYKAKIKKNQVPKHLHLKSPKDFYDKYVNFDFDDYIDLCSIPIKDKPYNQMYELEESRSIIESKNVYFLNVEMWLFKLAIIATLADKKPLWFACDVNFYGSRQQGIWDFKANDYDSLFNIKFNKNRSEMSQIYHIASNHAMLLCGFDLDEIHTDKNQLNLVKTFDKKSSIFEKYQKSIETLSINRWKVENSWGDKHGNKGFFSITDNWFNQFVSQAIVSKSAIKKFLENPKFINKKLASLISNSSAYQELFDKGLKTKPKLYSQYDPININLNFGRNK